MKRFRSVSIYYRDSKKIFQRIPHVKVFVDEKKKIPEKVYTLPPLILDEMDLVVP